MNKEEVKHFFEVEIENAENNISENSMYFNGVKVGRKKAVELNKAHIEFCKRAIMSLRLDF